MTSGGRQQVAGWALAGVLGLAGLAVLHLWTPSDDVRSSLCPSRRLFGLPCPGCGMTRALAHLAKGEWRAALAVHPLSPLIAAELAIGWIAWGTHVSGRAGVGGRLARRLWPAGLAPALAVNLALLFALWTGRLAAGALPR
jgi:uncharacterized protein DUF2752